MTQLEAGITRIRREHPGDRCQLHRHVRVRPGHRAMSPALDARLPRLQAELDDHSRVARYLGLDLERPIRSLGDGYPENAVALVGNITERLLKQLWRHHDIPGSPGREDPRRPHPRNPALHPQPRRDRGAARHPPAAQPVLPR